MKKYAAIFPGQGSQVLGMGQDLAAAYPACRKLFDDASEVLGYDLADLCLNGPEAELQKSDHAQPAIFVTSAACYMAFKELVPDFQPVVSAGLSSGEWAALYAAEVVSFKDTVKILEARGRYMQEACEENQGGMLSVIGLSGSELDSICEKANISIANLNSPLQTVLSGSIEGIKIAEGLALEAGAKRAIPLKVAGAFHSKFMQSAAEKFRSVLAEVQFSEPKYPVISNVTAAASKPEEMQDLLVKQITSSVQWVGSVKTMQDLGVTNYIEFGAGKILSGLIKRIDKQATLNNIQNCTSLDQVAKDW